MVAQCGIRRVLLIWAAGICAVTAGWPTGAPSAFAQAPPSRPCTSESYREFDFWIGEWDVYGPDARLVGRSKVDTILGGCVLHEQWDSAPAVPDAPSVQGRSFSLFDIGTKQWRQTYVDNTGSLLHLDGGMEGAVMILSGDRTGRDGRSRRYRISWSAISANEVRQQFEVSSDTGRTWQTVFDGHYRRRVAASKADSLLCAPSGKSDPGQPP